MIKYNSFNFDKNTIQQIRASKMATHRPMVYIITGDKEAYVGETVNVVTRVHDHLANQERKKLKTINHYLHSSAVKI